MGLQLFDNMTNTSIPMQKKKINKKRKKRETVLKGTLTDQLNQFSILKSHSKQVVKNDKCYENVLKCQKLATSG